MARSPSTNMNFWARAPLNLVADRVKNSVPPLLRTLRFCVGGQETELHDHGTDHAGGGQTLCRGVGVCEDHKVGGPRQEVMGRQKGGWG